MKSNIKPRSSSLIYDEYFFFMKQQNIYWGWTVPSFWNTVFYNGIIY